MAFLAGTAMNVFGQDVYFDEYTSDIMPVRDSERPIEIGAQVDESAVSITMYVDCNDPAADDANPGTEELPYKTIQGAVDNTDHSQATRIIVKPGVYREKVKLEDDQEWATHETLIIEAETPATVTLSGSEIYTDWSEESGHYVHDWQYKWGFAKTEYDNQPIKPLGKRTELVVIGNMRLKQYLSREELTDGSFSVDEANEKIYMIPPGGSLTEDMDVEMGIRRRQLEIIGRANVVIRGIRFIHSRGALDYATCRFLFSSNVLIEDCEMHNNSTIGLLFIRSTHVTVRRNNIMYNGGNGLDSYDLQNSIIEDCNISYNCWRSHMGKIYHYFPAGSKNVVMKNCLIRNNTFTGNMSSGCWLDVNCEFIEVDGNRAMENNRFGIYTETNCGPIVISNNIASGNNYAGIEVAESWNVTITGNTLYQNAGNQLGIRGGVRSQYGEDPEDWTYAPDTRAASIRYRYTPANLVLTDNTLFSSLGGSQLFGHDHGYSYVLYDHLPTYIGDNNRFFHTGSNYAVSSAPVYSDPETFEWTDMTLEEWQNHTEQDANSTWEDPGIFHMKTNCNGSEVTIDVFNDPGIDSMQLYISDMGSDHPGIFFIDWNDIVHRSTDYDAPYSFSIEDLTPGTYMFFGKAYTSDSKDLTSDRIEYTIPGTTHELHPSETAGETNLAVYPNPNHGQFTVTYSSDYYGDLDLGIYNSTGQRVHFEQLLKNDRIAVIDVSLPFEGKEGLYLVRIETGDQKKKKKIQTRKILFQN